MPIALEPPPTHAITAAGNRPTRSVSVTDEEALDAFHRLGELEGIIPALESAHAIAYALRAGSGYADDGPTLICLSGRGDKDVAHVARMEGRDSIL